MAFITIENVHMHWDSLDISFSTQVDKGEMLVITGPSGSGKSTILRMIAGLLPAGDGATVFVNGANVTDEAPGRRSLGMAFQSPALFQHMNVVDNASYALVSAGMSRREARAKASEWLEKFGLSAFEKRMPDSLSGGEAQRVSLVRTLIAEPALVLFDEPFSALDAPLRKKLGAEIRQKQKELGFAGIMVTHDIEEAKALGDVIVVLKEGRETWRGGAAQFEEELLK